MNRRTAAAMPLEWEPDDMFAALDKLELPAGNRQWRVEVFSVSDRNHYRWVQVGVSGDQDYLLTLRLPAGAGAWAAIPALSAWLAQPPATTHSPTTSAPSHDTEHLAAILMRPSEKRLPVG